jgi:hypothetical protein
MSEQIPWERIVRVGQRTMINRRLFAVAWTLGRYCNYSCSYCWPHAHSTTKHFRPLADLIRTVDAIKNRALGLGFDSFHFSFSGGEPTLHPDFFGLLGYIAELPITLQSIHVTSNVSPGPRWWARFCRLVAAVQTVSVTASWHPEAGARDPTGHRARFAEKVSLLRAHGVRSTVNVIMLPQRFDALLADAGYFQSRGLATALKPLTTDEGRVIANYTESQRSILRDNHMSRGNNSDENILSNSTDTSTGRNLVVPDSKNLELTDDTGKDWYLDHAEDLNAHDFNRFHGWMCEAGFRSVVILEPSGEMRRGYGCFEKPLGTAHEFSLHPFAMRCVTPSCLCSADSKIPKWRSTDPGRQHPTALDVRSGSIPV